LTDAAFSASSMCPISSRLLPSGSIWLTRVGLSYGQRICQLGGAMGLDAAQIST
jgi:hypothetical protein